jgi:hypothetical protein
MKFPFPSVKMVIYLLIVIITSALIIWGVAYLVAQYLNSFVVSGQDITKDPWYQLASWGMIFIFFAEFGQGVIISVLIGDKIIKEPQTILVKDVETAVSSLRYVTSFFYILIFCILGITAFLLLNTTNVGLNYSPILVNLSSPSIVTLSLVVIKLVVAVIAMGERLVRKDFQFYIAKMSGLVVGKTVKDEDKRMRFLGIVLNSYDKFMAKNVPLDQYAEFKMNQFKTMILV